MSERRACKAIGRCRMTVRYETCRPDDGKVHERMKAIAQKQRRFSITCAAERFSCRRWSVMVPRCVCFTAVVTGLVERAGGWLKRVSKGRWRTGFHGAAIETRVPACLNLDNRARRGAQADDQKDC